MTLVLNGTTGVSSVDGSASTPAIQGTDSNTGVFFPAADTVAIATGGTEAMRVNSSQNVGIGTTSPTSRLHLYGSAPTIKLQHSATGSQGVLRWVDSGGTDRGGIASYYNVADTGNLEFLSGSTTRMTLDSSGNLLVGTTTSSGSGNLIAAGVYNNTTASGANVQVDNTGPGLLRRSTSSIVYKTNVEPIDAAYIANALKFRPVWYRSLCDGDRKDWSWYGLIAEEVGAIDPRLVHWRMLETSVDANGQTVQTPLEKPVAEGVMYDRVVVLALGLIQKQETAIQELTAKLDAAEARIAALEAA